MKIVVHALLLAVFCSACLSSAPTTYELNRRSGLAVSVDSSEKPQLPELPRLARKLEPKELPERLAPRLAKVWVYDQPINDNAWLSGTWIYLEVEGARWAEPSKGGEL